MLRMIALTAAPLKPALARQARTALVMDSITMSFDPRPGPARLSGLPETGLLSALTKAGLSHQEQQLCARNNSRR